MVLSTLWCKNWRHRSTGGNSCKGKSPGQGNKGIFKERRHVKGRQYCLRKTANSRSSMTSVFSRSITRWKKIFTRLLLCYFKQLFSPGRAKIDVTCTLLFLFAQLLWEGNAYLKVVLLLFVKAWDTIPAHMENTKEGMRYL